MYSFHYSIQFEIDHPSSDLDSAVAIFDRPPTTYVKRGAPRYGVQGRPLHRLASVSHLAWRLQDGEIECSESQPLDMLLEGVLRRLEEQRQHLARLRISGAVLRIEIAVRPVEAYSVIVFKPEVLNALASLGISLVVDVVVPPGKLSKEEGTK
jgi:hypothetical protein